MPFFLVFSLEIWHVDDLENGHNNCFVIGLEGEQGRNSIELHTWKNVSTVLKVLSW